jgi:hypothetical protein
MRQHRWWWQLIWFLPGLLLLVSTVRFSLLPDFVPDDMMWLNVFLFFFVLVVAPKVIVSFSSLFGKRGLRVGLFTVPVLWFVLFYGSFVGNRRFEVRHVELAFADLPASFDGYRIVQFSDIHLGSMDRKLLQEAVDSINAQRADLAVFTGDIQNKCPDEIDSAFIKTLSGIRAVDGVVSVMGNHDYPYYIDAPDDEKYINEERVVGIQQDMKWKVLLNGHCYMRRGQDSIVVAGMENDGVRKFPQKGNVNRSLYGVSRSRFIVMLQHDPSCWRRKILRHCHAQLTLSGHTHGMQFELFGWSPLSLFHEADGLYTMGNRYLYVSKGLGGVVPFRFGATPEIVVITLKRG